MSIRINIRPSFKIIALIVAIILTFHLLSYLLNYFIPIIYRFDNRDPDVEGIFNVNPIWFFKASERILTTPVIYQNLVIILSQDEVQALVNNSGALVWKISVEGGKYSAVTPILYENKIVLAKSDGNISLRDLDKGHLLWSSNADYPRYSHIDAIQMSEDYIFVTRYDISITTYSVSTGDVVWERNIPGRASSQLISNGDKLYLGSAHEFRVYQSSDGKLLKEKWFTGIINTMYQASDVIYIGFATGPDALIALNSDTLDEIWTIKFDERVKSEVRAILLWDRVLYFTSRELYAVNSQNGEIMWESGTDEYLEQPIILGNTIFVRDTIKYLYAYDLTTWREVGKMTVPYNWSGLNGPFRGPATNGQHLFVPINQFSVAAYLSNKLMQLQP